jgi:D-aminopeptidase
MICHGFKGGIGTASRIVEAVGSHVVGVLVQANYGRRERLRVDGVPVGTAIPPSEVPLPGRAGGAPGGSIIVLVATSAPLLPDQCRRLAQRAGLGIARMGGVGENSSGDLFLCFSTGNRGLPAGDFAAETPPTVTLEMVPAQRLTPLFDAVVEATEEAILNALCAAETMTGHNGATAHAFPVERAADLLARREAAGG